MKPAGSLGTAAPHCSRFTCTEEDTSSGCLQHGRLSLNLKPVRKQTRDITPHAQFPHASSCPVERGVISKYIVKKQKLYVAQYVQSCEAVLTGGKTYVNHHVAHTSEADGAERLTCSFASVCFVLQAHVRCWLPLEFKISGPTRQR